MTNQIDDSWDHGRQKLEGWKVNPPAEWAGDTAKTELIDLGIMVLRYGVKVATQKEGCLVDVHTNRDSLVLEIKERDQYQSFIELIPEGSGFLMVLRTVRFGILAHCSAEPIPSDWREKLGKHLQDTSSFVN